MRAAVFLDGKSFHVGWRERANEARIDFSQMSSWLMRQVGADFLFGSYYYTGVEVGELAHSEAQQRLTGFLDMLEHQPGFFVRRLPRRVRYDSCLSCGTQHRYTEEKGVDTAMVVDMLRLASVGAYDVAVLVSGDADHTPVLHGIRDIGKQVYLATWGGHGLSDMLRRAAFDHVDLMDGLRTFRLDEPALDVDINDRMLDELRRAEEHFSGGYVGLSYFLNRWKSSLLPSQPDDRHECIVGLIELGQVEVYESGTGDRAVRRIH